MLRSIPRMILSLLFVLMILGAGTRDDPCLVYNTETVKVVFDDIYTSQGITLSIVECEVLSEAGIAVATWRLTSGFTLVGAEYQVPIRVQASTLPNGLYQLRVRVVDTFGNVSGWSVVMWANKMWRDIPTPGGCRTVA